MRSPSHVSSPTPSTQKYLPKHELLAKTTESICALTKHVVRNLASRDDLVGAKGLELRSKANAFKAREELERPKYCLRMKWKCLKAWETWGEAVN